MNILITAALVVLATIASAPTPSFAHDNATKPAPAAQPATEDEGAELAKKLSNPIADLIGSVSKLSSFGTSPASYQIGLGYFVAKPDNGASWKLRAALTILLPRKK